MKKYWAARRGGSETAESSSSKPAAKTTQAARGTAKRGPRTMSTPSSKAHLRRPEGSMGEAAKERREASDVIGEPQGLLPGRAVGAANTPRARCGQARPPQDVSRGPKAHFAGAEEAVGEVEERSGLNRALLCPFVPWRSSRPMTATLPAIEVACEIAHRLGVGCDVLKQVSHKEPAVVDGADKPEGTMNDLPMALDVVPVLVKPHRNRQSTATKNPKARSLRAESTSASPACERLSRPSYRWSGLYA